MENKGFQISRKNYPKIFLISVTFEKNVTTEDFSKFICILDRFVNEKSPFAIYVDTRQCGAVPFQIGKMLGSWMKKRKPDIPGVLIASAIVLSSSVIVGLVNLAFKIQPPSSLNIVTRDENRAQKFIDKIINPVPDIVDPNVVPNVDIVFEDVII